MIIILTQSFPSRLGGIENLVSNLALGLSKKEKVIVFADRHNFFYDTMYDNEYKDQIIVRRTSGIKFFRRRKKIKELKIFIESQQVKLVIADSWKSLELGIDYLNEKNIPTICLAHGNELLSNEEKKSKRIFQTLEKASSVIANSKFTMSLVKKIIPKNNNINFVYPGAIDLRQKTKSNNFLKIEGKPVLITLARLEKRKGHAEILKTIKKLTSDFPTIQYIIAGEGPEKPYLKKIVKEKELSTNVVFLGLINDAQKKFLFELVDLMIMPTLDETEKQSIEGFGIAYLEAAFFAIPSIASKAGGTPEAVLHKSTGIIINSFDELYDCTRKLLQDNDERISLGQNAQKRSLEEFHWDVVINNYLSIFSNIIAKKQ